MLLTWNAARVGTHGMGMGYEGGGGRTGDGEGVSPSPSSGHRNTGLAIWIVGVLWVWHVGVSKSLVTEHVSPIRHTTYTRLGGVVYPLLWEVLLTVAVQG